MFFLAGVLGMMALGSVVIASTGGLQDDDELPERDVPDTGTQLTDDLILDDDPGSMRGDDVGDPPDSDTNDGTGGDDADAGVAENGVTDRMAAGEGVFDSGVIDNMPGGAGVVDTGETLVLISPEAAVDSGGEDEDGDAAEPDGVSGAPPSLPNAASALKAPMSPMSNEEAATGSLFARLGLINMAGLDDGSGIGTAGMPAGGPEADDIASTEADTLSGDFSNDASSGGSEDDIQSSVASDETGLNAEGSNAPYSGAVDTVSLGPEGGGGADAMMPGHWLTGEAAMMLDYDAAEDQIVIVYDDSELDTAPEVEMRVSKTNSDVTEILLNGQVLTMLPTADAPALDQLFLVGESLAAQVALA
ncbi:hypothetical protein GGQ68_001052 [Sagittula marina]|uniref:Uncharacterized protein n=1 Tax=Sagittula marina TaxID=943940 RepID=A0A7W6GQU7_9RHOB|nr:hypothetical protein [Sagittula marina]MBB3984736.1 hypothetical protein [Sagittula marina]